jgi:biopolymer transport protein ExbD
MSPPMSTKAKTVSFAPAAAAGESGILVAPLIDIVFLLICFYLLVAQLITRQKDPSVQLPAMASPLADKEGPAEFVINLRRDGTITVGGRPASVAETRRMLADQLARARRTRQPLRAVVRADRRGNCGALDEVLQACRDAGLRQIVFRSSQKEGP